MRVGRLFGIDVVLDYSWLIIAVLVTFALQFEFSQRAPAVAGGAVWAAAVVGSALFFASVLIHEFSHSLVAVRRGMVVRRIRLFIFGGVSEIESEITSPGAEFAVTIAGPFSSFALAAVFFGLVPLLEGNLAGIVAGRVAWVNLALGAFNLLPGFPLDGGRVLRSVVWKATGDFTRATRVAVAGGRILAGLLIGLGVLSFVVGQLGGLWLALIGWFLFQAAGAAPQANIQTLARGVRVRQVMMPSNRSVAGELTLQQLFTDPALPPGPLPVVIGGRVRGLASLGALRRVPPELWATTRVADVMTPLGPADVVEANDDLGTALERIVGGNRSLAVVDDGRLVGVVSAADVTRWVQRASR